MSNTLKPGELVSTSNLASQFNVNRHTVRRALEMLQQAGVVRIEKGRGAFVQEDVLLYKIGQKTRFQHNLERQGRRGEGRLVSSAVVTSPDNARRFLGAHVDRVILLDTISETDGMPVCVGRHMFPADLFADLQSVYEAERSITAVFRHYGIDDYARTGTRISTRMPTADEAKRLMQPRTIPVLETAYVDFDTKTGRRLKFSIGCFSGQRVHLTIGDDEVFLPASEREANDQRGGAT